MFQKNTTAVLDYTWNYAAWLGGTDAIASAAWHTPAGISAVSMEASTATTTVWLSGGAPGNVYEITNVIWTTSGRTQVRKFEIGIE
jgi:hypothetical protein